MRPIGALFIGYGALLGFMTVALGVIGLQGANEETSILAHFAVALPALAVPAVLVLIGWGVMQGRSAAYYAALLLPVILVPLAIWGLRTIGGRVPTPRAQAAELLRLMAVAASGSVLLSVALFFSRWHSSRRGDPSYGGG